MKWYTYLICFILVIVGTFCGIQLYKEVKAESYINGSIDISNKFSQENLNYSSTSLVFYHDLYDDTDTYSFDQELPKVENFNGQENTYELWLNDFIILDAEFNAGSVYSTIQLDFYNEYGNILNSSTLNISVKYLSSKTQITLSTKGQESASFLEQYFKDNGIRLKVVEII
jgi:hypothetical protein